MKENEIYILNPDYNLKTDVNRVIIFNRSSDPIYDSFVGFVHPVYAILISLFDGECTAAEVIKKAAIILKKQESKISDILFPLVENNKRVYFDFDGYHFSFPTRLLLKKEPGMISRRIDPETFLISNADLEMKEWRLNSPLDILFMVNTRCCTDCYYCYADKQRNMDCEIPFERLKEIFIEARKLNLRAFDLTGGELFLYKKWELFLKESLDNGFMPNISTKCPIDEKTIEKLDDLGIKKIQISVDSIIKEELMSILGVSADYHSKLMNTFRFLDERGFDIYTNSQITAINQENFEKLLDYLLSLKHIKRINIGAAAFSLYKGENAFKKYRPGLEYIKKIEDKISKLKDQYSGRIVINFSGYTERGTLIGNTTELKKKDFLKRARCSANFFGFVILPDGKVTICEELYWHPKFIIGDITKNSIEEIWNSERALELYNISKDMIGDESECKNCAEFSVCHKQLGVCWKEVFYAYGFENWDYPDPRCPYAPKPFREYYL